MAPAFLYQEVRRSTALRDHRPTLLALAGLGLAGLAAAALFGHWVLVLVFGKAFAPAYGVLVAGCGAAVLFFIDQWVQISITANNRPGVLALKWASACAICIATLALATPRLGPMAGPLGLALGVLAGWVAVALTSGHRARTASPLERPACSSRS
jgi:O-antigen/teichoic acid export membrane protein